VAGPADDAEQRRGIVIVEARLEGEAAAQRRGEQTGTVVAPTRVNLGRLSRTLRAFGPWSIMMSSR